MREESDLFDVPHERDLVEFFGVEAIERDVDAAYWCYESADDRGLTVRLSFDVYERSVQTELRLRGVIVAGVSHEGAVSMRCDGSTLCCEFRTGGSKASMTLQVHDGVRINWATLRA